MTTLSNLLEEARRSGRPVAGSEARAHSVGLDDAYRLQSAAFHARSQEGAAFAGYKIALTSPAAQEALAIHEPAFGRLLDDMHLPAGAAVGNLAVCAPLVEAELLFRIGAELSGPGCTADRVRQATEVVVPALEIADCRVADWDVSAGLFVADNSAAGWFMSAEDTPVDLDRLKDVRVEVRLNGSVSGTGVGSSLMGDPSEAVAWLANKLHEFELVIAPGDLVLSGALAPPVPLRDGDRVRAEFSGGGTLEVQW